MNYTLCCTYRWFLLVLSQIKINGLIKMNQTRYILLCNHDAYHKPFFLKNDLNDGTSEKIWIQLTKLYYFWVNCIK
jgi:hypothetical protein